MYNRYIPDGAVYTRIPVEEEEPRPGPARAQPPKRGGQAGQGGGSPGRLEGLLSSLGLGKLDSGDLLLLLIILLLLTEGDDLELVIALGLALVMGLGE